jgi:hypothetical protein
MKKLDAFVVTSVVNNLINMSDEDLQKVAVLLANFPNGEKLADMIGFAIFDKSVVTDGINSYAYPEAQEA